MNRPPMRHHTCQSDDSSSGWIFLIVLPLVILIVTGSWTWALVAFAIAMVTRSSGGCCGSSKVHRRAAAPGPCSKCSAPGRLGARYCQACGAPVRQASRAASN